MLYYGNMKFDPNEGPLSCKSASSKGFNRYVYSRYNTFLHYFESGAFETNISDFATAFSHLIAQFPLDFFSNTKPCSLLNHYPFRVNIIDIISPPFMPRNDLVRVYLDTPARTFVFMVDIQVYVLNLQQRNYSIQRLKNVWNRPKHTQILYASLSQVFWLTNWGAN